MNRCHFSDPEHLPNLEIDHVDVPESVKLTQEPGTHPPRILLLYGSLRKRSYSRLLTEEAARLLRLFGAGGCGW